MDWKAGVAMAALVLMGAGCLEEDTWTLMVCEGQMYNGECEDTSYVVPGYLSLQECFAAGADGFMDVGFECGYSCEEKGYGMRVCGQICNANGCQE